MHLNARSSLLKENDLIGTIKCTILVFLLYGRVVNVLDRTRLFKVQVCALLSGYTASFFNRLSDEQLDKEYNHLLISEIAYTQMNDYRNKESGGNDAN